MKIYLPVKSFMNQGIFPATDSLPRKACMHMISLPVPLVRLLPPVKVIFGFYIMFFMAKFSMNSPWGVGYGRRC